MARLAKKWNNAYGWSSDTDNHEHASARVAARTVTLHVRGRPAQSLDGIEQFTSLRELSLKGAGPLDLSPLAAVSSTLRGLDLAVDGPITGFGCLAVTHRLTGMTLSGTIEALNASIAAIPWARLSRVDYVMVDAHEPGVVDVRPLGPAPALRRLRVTGAMIGPRDIDGRKLAELLPPTLERLGTDALDDDDLHRIDEAAEARSRSTGRRGRREPADFYVVDMILGGTAEAPWAWIAPDEHDNLEDVAWLLTFDAARLVERRTGDEAPNAHRRAERRLKQLLRETDPTIGRRLEFDTTAEALTLALRDGDDRPAVEAALHTLKGELDAGPTDADDG